MKQLMLFPKIIGPLCAAFCLIFATAIQAEETAPPATGSGEGINQSNTNAPTASSGLMGNMTPELVAAMERDHQRELLQQVLVPIAFFGMIVSVVGLGLFANHRKNRILHETIRAMIEKGQPIPPELLRPKHETHQASSDLGRGLILTGIGLGLMFFLFTQHNDNWGVGMIPLLMGAACLIAWKIESRKKNGQD